MKKVVLALGIATAQMFAVGAFAQGEVGGVKKPPAAGSVSPEDKAAARTERRSDAAAANQAGTLPKTGEVGAVKQPPAAGHVAPEAKAAARAERKADTAEANKAGTLPKAGEVGPTK